MFSPQQLPSTESLSHISQTQFANLVHKQILNNFILKITIFCLLQIGTTARSWNQWMQQFLRRSLWQARDQAQATIRPPAPEVTRTRGEDQVQGEDTALRRESDWSFNPLVG